MSGCPRNCEDGEVRLTDRNGNDYYTVCPCCAAKQIEESKMNRCENHVFGNELTPEDQKAMLNQYVYRNSMECPNRKINRDPATVWATDELWLKHTQFKIRKDGRIDERTRSCMGSTPEIVGRIETAEIFSKQTK